MSGKKVFETDGLAGDWAQPGGVTNTDTYEPKANRGGAFNYGASPKDRRDVQHVLYTDIGGTAEDKLTRAVPEAGVYANPVAASATIDPAGANNALLFTAKTPGPAGNDISITYVDPGGATATLGVVTTGTSIVVNLGRAASAINTTGTLLAAAIAGDTNANALVSVANAGADNGSGLVTAISRTPLTGGNLGTIVT